MAQENLHFEQLPEEFGWSNTTIKDVIQDADGFLWIASWHGLAKYDGYSLTKYFQNLNNKNGLNSNKITCLFKDSKDRLWIGTTYAGLYQYIPETDSFTQYAKDDQNPNSLSNNDVWCVTEDPYGDLWIGTGNGLNRFDPEKKSFQHFYHVPNDETSLSNNFIYALAITETGELWVGTEMGLNRLVRNKKNDPAYFINYPLSPPNTTQQEYYQNNFVYTLEPSKLQLNTLWIGTSNGLKKATYSDNLIEFSVQHYYQTSVETKKGLSHPYVTDLLEKENELWIATRNGLNLLNISTNSFDYFVYDKTNTNSLVNNEVLSFYEDHFGLLWIGTQKGLSKLNLGTSNFNALELDNSLNLNNSYITSIAAPQNQKGIYISTNGGGLNYFETTTQFSNNQGVQYSLATPDKSSLSNFISCLIIDQFDDLWISTHGAGLLKVSTKDISVTGGTITVQKQFTKENQLEDDYIMALSESNNGNIWIGYWGEGLSRYDRRTNQFHHYKTTEKLTIDFTLFPNVNLYETTENGKNYLWVGTRGNGLLKLYLNEKEDKLQLIKAYQNTASNISNDYITEIYQDKKENLWVGTENGLNYLNIANGTTTFYTEKEGLSGNIIQSVLSDEIGTIWVSTHNGISRIIPKSGAIKNFNKYDGLKDNFFYQAALKMSDGQLIFSGVSGLNIFKPTAIKNDPIAPKVVISDFRLANKSVLIGPLKDGRTIIKEDISITKNLDLNYQDNDVSFEFVGLQFAKPAKIQYAYQLVGFDEDWIYTDAKARIAHYTNLPYEEFIFKVKAANADGVWSDPTTLNLTIRPPFWRTNWAYLGYALLFLGLLYSIFRVTRIRAEYRHDLKVEKLERQQQQTINQAKLAFFTNISHELRTPLTLIVSPLEQFLRERQGDKQQQKIFTRMYHNANRLLTMINHLLDVRKSEAGLMKLKVAEGNIVKFVKENVLAFKGLANQQEIALTVNAEKENIALWYDRNQLEKVFFNLLSNALKFTPQGGAISLIIKENLDKNCLLIELTDNGSGIPSTHLSQIFDRFYQVEDASNQQTQGSGIGLALTKNIVALHHGSIEVTSEEMKGTTFLIQLPFGETHFTDHQKISNFKNSEDLGNYVATNISKEGIIVAQPTPLITSSTKNKATILLVEDNTDIRAYLKENLETLYQIEEADNGKKGLEKALTNPPDLVLADISMPEMDGIAMCEQLKTNVLTSHIPVILLTARTSLLFKIDGLETGADDYITKPFNMRLLLARVQNLLQSRQKLKSKFAKNFDLSPSGVVMNSVDEALLSRIKIVLEKHLDDTDFSVEQLAKTLLMSRMQLYRKTKSLIGKSPSDIIRMFRLERAVDLIKTGHYNISDVTYMVGYNDLKAFRKQFKKAYGVMPSEYLEKNP